MIVRVTQIVMLKEFIEMSKINIVSLIIVLIINSNLFSKENNYYYLDNKECIIAIPLNFHIQGGFTKNRISFFKIKNNKIKNIVFIKGNQKKYSIQLKEGEKNDHNILVEEKKIGHLLYQKFKVPIANGVFEYRYNIFGNSFFIGGNNIAQKDIDYMIQHCIKTYTEN